MKARIVAGWSWWILWVGGNVVPPAQGVSVPQEQEAGAFHDSLVYVGTYTRGESRGIYLLRLNGATGEVSGLSLAAEAENPSFLALHPSLRYLYAVHEVSSLEGEPGGAVSAFSIEEDGRLRLLNRQSSGGSGPCYISLDAAGRNALVANYGGGSVAVLPIASDGRLKKISSRVQHQGSSVHPRRQQGPHAHCIVLDPANRLAFAADLGLDQILVYRFDGDRGTLAPHPTPSASLAAGAGPRHFTFHPTGRWAYSINELNSTVTVFSYDSEQGTLSELETLSTLPPDLEVSNTTAEVQVHPSGKFLYASNRGHDSLAIFEIDPSEGHLRMAGHQSTLGRTPRNFGIDPSGRFLLAANQGSDSLAVFRIQPDTGRLIPTGQLLKVPAPVCVKFLPLAKPSQGRETDTQQ